MSSFFTILCYFMFAYGISVLFTNGDGPFHIFTRIRVWSDDISEHFGMLFRCMLCFPTNVGWVFSLFNWFCLPIAISPFNIIFHNCPDFWWLAAIMDACATGGVCRTLWNIDDYIDKNTPIYEDEEQRDN